MIMPKVQPARTSSPTIPVPTDFLNGFCHHTVKTLPCYGRRPDRAIHAGTARGADGLPRAADGEKPPHGETEADDDERETAAGPDE